VAGTSPAAADEVPPPPPTGVPLPTPSIAPAETVLPADPEAGFSLKHVCTGRTDAPHNSTHYPGYALVSAVTNCVGVPVTVTVDLYVERVGGWIYLDRGTASGFSTIRNNARWNCPSGTVNTFLGLGYHTAVGHTIGQSSYQRAFRCS
jgi:hypothetical protein